jgi:DNA-binding protein H-NS
LVSDLDFSPSRCARSRNDNELVFCKGPQVSGYVFYSIFLKGKKMATYKELKAQAEALLKQAETARRAEISAVVAEIQARMREFGITIDDLKGGVKKSKSRGAVAAKYRNPATGDSWSGRGRAPRWLADAMAKGRSKEDFKV